MTNCASFLFQNFDSVDLKELCQIRFAIPAIRLDVQTVILKVNFGTQCPTFISTR